MDDSTLNSQYLSSSSHLENVEALIKNLEKQTISTLDNFEHVIGGDRTQYKSFITSSLTSSGTMNIDDNPDDNFLVHSISQEPGENSTDSLFAQRDLFGESVINNRNRTPTTAYDERTVPTDQSITGDGFQWDDQYDARQNYRLTFSESKQRPHHHHHHHNNNNNNHHSHHLHKSNHQRPKTDEKKKKRSSSTSNGQSTSTYLDDLPPDTSTTNLNDWSMRSSFDLEQSLDMSPQPYVQQQQPILTTSSSTTALLRSQAQKEAVPLPHSPGGSSTTSSSSSTSWKRMKESQRTSSGVEAKETRPPSPFSLYRIFQQKTSSTPPSIAPQHARGSAFQIYRHLSADNDTTAVVPNTSTMSISGENILDNGGIKHLNAATKRSKTREKREESTQFPPHITDQGIQTSMLMSQTQMTAPSHEQYRRTSKSLQTDNLGVSRSSRQAGNNSNVSSGDSYFPTKSESADRSQQAPNTHRFMSPSPSSSNLLSVPKIAQQTSTTTSSTYKSLPDLSFISQYSKEIPHSSSQTTSPVPPTNFQSSSQTEFITSSNSTSQQQQQPQSERPRTLKSIKRYKNSKHQTEPCVFYSPQLRKTFAAIPAAQVQSGQNQVMMFKMQQQQQQRTHGKPPPTLKSCLKHNIRANSCDIAAVLRLQPTLPPRSSSAAKNEKKQIYVEQSKIETPVIDNSAKDRSSSLTPPSPKRRYSEPYLLEQHEQKWDKTNHVPSSSELPNYMLLNSADNKDNQQPQSTHHYSDYDLNMMVQTKKSVSFSENIAKHLISPCNPGITFTSTIEQEQQPTNDLLLTLHGKEYNTMLKTLRYGAKDGMRRCQTDIIVMNPVNLHSFTDSPPNEFRLQDDGGQHGNNSNDEDDDQAILEKTTVNYVEDGNIPSNTSDILTTTPPTPSTPTTTASSSNVEPEHNKIEQLLLNEKENVNTEQQKQQQVEKTKKINTEIKPEIISSSQNTHHTTEGKTLMSNSFLMNSSTLTQHPPRTMEAVLDSVTETIKQIYEIKRGDKSFFLNNESNPQLDYLLQNNLCLAVRDILENGLKHQQQQSLFTAKRITLWKIIDLAVGQDNDISMFDAYHLDMSGQIPSPFYDAKMIAQNVQTTSWFCRFQAFIYALLNKSELTNWLYHYMRQKDFLLRYYDPTALMLVNNHDTFNMFERLMSQFEKLSPFAFRLTFIPPSLSPTSVSGTMLASNDDLTTTSTTSNGVKDWAMTMSRRASKTFGNNSSVTQPIIATVDHTPVITNGGTIRSTLSKKFNMRTWFRGNGNNNTVSDPTTRKGTTSAVTTKLPVPKHDTNFEMNSNKLRTTSPRRPPLTNVFNNNSTNAATSTQKPVTPTNNRTSISRRGASPAPANSSPTTATTATAFHSKIPRPSLNVDKTNKPLSARYRAGQNTTTTTK
ncbi:unnamed protein product [Didymodactylos carnosus]|uniref:RUN domain-containing protein n=1 Tax=Didymodactylos carnosus TaxID=1234261 RepID=A0A8S2D2C3_9BILA|nr:unnamed protein product [Didymodactylos carnosus]CAF3645647.1 unnamed protein product [Didymodactylos carnosus]